MSTPTLAVPVRPQPQDLRERRTWKNLFRCENGQKERDDDERDQNKAPVTWRSLRRFWQFVHPNRHLVYLLCICTLINQGMTVVMPVAIGRIMDSILPRHDAALLNIVAIGLVVFVLLRAFYLYVEREVAGITGSLTVGMVRARLHQHLQSMSLRFLEDYQVGRLCSRVMNDTEQIRNLLLGGFIQTASNSLRLVFVATTLLYIDWRLTLVSCCTMPFFMVGFASHVRRLRPAHKELSEDGSRLWAKASETFSGIRVVKTYGSEAREDLSFMKRVHMTMRKGLLIRRTHHDMVVIWEISAWLGLVALIWFGGHRVMSGALTVGELVAFYGLLGLLHGPIAELINISEQVQAAMASIERIGEILDMKPDICDRPDARPANALKGEVVFENVGFKYKADEKAKPEQRDPDAPPRRTRTLTNINLHVKPGQVIALVGASGSGKTTMINLLARFYDVDEGAVKIDGVDLRDYKMDSYRRNLAIVLQENFLFRGTIRENIAYSRPHATEAEIVEAAKAAGAWGFIQESENGLDTMCGERGVKLSGGQKQRLSIARAILADPRILILDEATSALDSQSEAHIQEALDRLMKGRTTFVIAHRLSTIVHADKIVVLEQGEIAEMGTHEELLAREGKYFDLFMEQYGKVKFSGRTADVIGRWRKEQKEHLKDTAKEQAAPAPLPVPAAAQTVAPAPKPEEVAHVRQEAEKPERTEKVERATSKSGRFATARRETAASGRFAPAPAD
ncbi:MAG: ABC transporter ATP-binding protein [Planctomycetota bacterium]|nr:ABC transporter ATP-binding protein [Planctomycetota bacterium]